jgi:hypothetical protein
MAGCHRTRFTLCCIGSASLIPDEMFADSFTDVGGRGVPPMIVVMVMVMVLQRVEALGSGGGARFAFDARWKYAAPHRQPQNRNSRRRCRAGFPRTTSI